MKYENKNMKYVARKMNQIKGITSREGQDAVTGKLHAQKTDMDTHMTESRCGSSPKPK